MRECEGRGEEAQIARVDVVCWGMKSIGGGGYY